MLSREMMPVKRTSNESPFSYAFIIVLRIFFYKMQSCDTSQEELVRGHLGKFARQKYL